MNEVWKDIDGYEGIYQVSNLGKVRSLDRKVWNYIKPGRILKTHNNGHGYYNVSLHNKDKIEKHAYIHILVAKAFIPNPNNYTEVNHKDFDKTNNCVDNLEWVTHRENCKHAWVTGLRTKSEEERRKKIQMYNIKLKSINEHDVFKIYNEYKTKKVTMKDLSEKYNVCRQTICNIVNKKNAIARVSFFSFYFEDLIQDKRNYRKHNKKNLDLIKKSVKEVGLARSIVIDNENNIICGNGLTSTLDKNTPIQIIETDGTELVVVKRTDLKFDDDKRKQLAIMDNSTNDTSEFDIELLQEEFNTNDLNDWGIYVPEISDIDVNSFFEDTEVKAKEPKTITCPACGEIITL